MAAIDFPSSPSTGQLFVTSNQTWKWDGTAWVALRPSPNYKITAGSVDAGSASSATAKVIATAVGASADFNSPILRNATVLGSLAHTGSFTAQPVRMAAADINCAYGNYFSTTLTGNTTFTVSNVPTSGVYSFTLEVTHTAGSITWFSGVVWQNATAPSLSTGNVHLFMFVTDDGGVTWLASSLVNYAA